MKLADAEAYLAKRGLDEALHSTPAVAEALQVSVRSLKRWQRDKGFPRGRRLGRYNQISTAAIAKWLAATQPQADVIFDTQSV